MRGVMGGEEMLKAALPGVIVQVRGAMGVCIEVQLGRRRGGG